MCLREEVHSGPSEVASLNRELINLLKELVDLLIEARIHLRGFPGAVVKDYACQYRRFKRHRFDPWVGKMPGEGHGRPLQCPSWRSPGQRSLAGQRVADSPTQLPETWGILMKIILLTSGSSESLTKGSSLFPKQTGVGKSCDRLRRVSYYGLHILISCIIRTHDTVIILLKEAVTGTPWTCPQRLTIS